ncbi:tRNA uridine-5-carboxymethylaminomethyl(34) synthesis GTPase MnmE [Pseudochelatococcus sp. B33]
MRVAHNSDTIVAPATAAGRSAIAVVRLSGPATRDIVTRTCGALPRPRYASLRAIRDGQGHVLDHGLVLFFAAPASFTGEDVAELHLHGGQAVVSAVLRGLLDTGLCRLAEAGEFSRRAFLNGKLDLTAAEGIADLIDAETEAQRRQAMRQLEGVLSAAVEDWRERLLEAMALVEASLDFSDEGDVPDGLIEQGVATAAAIRAEIAAALDDGRAGERLRDGFTVAIVGPPNAGKSTLLNRIAGRDVAIVSPLAGTTRDAIEVRCDLAGTPVVFVDTAGLRDTDDPIEREGVERARKRAAAADLVLRLRATDDRSGASFESDSEWAAGVDMLAVRTKSDLEPDRTAEDNVIAISAVTGEGIDDLLAAVKQRVAASAPQAPLITRERHRRAFMDTAEHLDRAVRASSVDADPELVAEDMRLALRALGRITGGVDVEDILDRLFSGFCIGK